MENTMTILMTLLLAAAPFSAVEYDAQVDFSRYATWSWSAEMTVATGPLADKRIREAIENGLATRGLSRTEKGGELLVGYHASKTTDIALAPIGTAAAVTPTGIQYAEKGSVVVFMVDAASGKVVWRGHVAGVLRYSPTEIAAQVKAAVETLLESLPPGLRHPAP
jgi:hypothetical protein